MAKVNEKYRHKVDKQVYKVTRVSGSAVVLLTPTNLEMIVSLKSLKDNYEKE